MLGRALRWLTTLVIGLLLVAKAVARDRSDEHRDEIDLAVILGSRSLRMKSRPFIGGTVLVLAGAATIDLRRVEPAPTGIELAILVVGGSLVVVVPPGWRPDLQVDRIGAGFASSLAAAEEGPLFRVKGRVVLGALALVSRAAPVAVAS
ncbi:MAG TPA: hypothetical protein VIA81_04695 [Acidimicrobiia bacterium]|jgi:hypothetical protein